MLAPASCRSLPEFVADTTHDRQDAMASPPARVIFPAPRRGASPRLPLGHEELVARYSRFGYRRCWPLPRDAGFSHARPRAMLQKRGARLPHAAIRPGAQKPRLADYDASSIALRGAMRRAHGIPPPRAPLGQTVRRKRH